MLIGHISSLAARKRKFKSYSFTSRGVGAGTYYAGGYYFAPVAHAVLNQGAKTQTLGAANVPYAAHVIVVLSGVGTDDKTTGAVRLVVSGTSITDAGVRNATPDTEVIIADIENAANITDAMFETSKKWIGQVTLTLDNDGTGDATNFALTFNYGFAKYEDYGNINFDVTDFEAIGLAAAADAAFNVTLLHHSPIGWTYSAAAFNPGGTVLADMNAVHVTETDPDNTEPFAFKIAGLKVPILGNNSEGVIIKIVTGQNNTVQEMNMHIGVLPL